MARTPKSLSGPPPERGTAVRPGGRWPTGCARRRLGEVAGQAHLLAPGKPLTRLLAGELHSAILWGPPGSGKTTLARLLADTAGAHFVALSAVLAGVKEVREAVAFAQANPGQPTVLFLDEVHRFNKAQQDAFLPFVEDGTLIFIGATTENPAFALNNALLSRARVYVLKPLADEDLVAILSAALRDPERGLGARQIIAGEAELLDLARGADGDARRALNLLEVAAGLVGDDRAADARRSSPRSSPAAIAASIARATCSTSRSPRCTSRCAARIPMRRSTGWPACSTAAAIRPTWPGGSSAWPPRTSATRIPGPSPWRWRPGRPGSAWARPEGELALAQAVVFLACAAKSNAVYTAWQAAQADAQAHGSLAVPPPCGPRPRRSRAASATAAATATPTTSPTPLRPAPATFPEELGQPVYYQPVPRGLEQRIAEKLADFRERNRAARQGKPPV